MLPFKDHGSGYIFRKFHHVGLEQLCVARALESLQLDTLVIFLPYNLKLNLTPTVFITA